MLMESPHQSQKEKMKTKFAKSFEKTIPIRVIAQQDKEGNHVGVIIVFPKAVRKVFKSCPYKESNFRGFYQGFYDKKTGVLDMGWCS